MHRIIVVAWALSWACTAYALPPDTWLVAVGNNAGDPQEVTLLYAERDAERMARTLRQHGGLKGARSRVLAGEDATALRAVLDATETHLAALPARSPSALIVYYSGHADENGLHLGGTHLPLDELRTRLKASKAKIRILIVDACRSGAITRVKGVRRNADFKVDLVDRVAAEGMAMITSSTAGESSQESDRLGGSFFSHHFLGALRGAADRNGDQHVTLGEAYTYAYDQTVRSSGQTLAVQHPTYAFDVKGRGDLVLTTITARTGGMANLRLGPAVDYVVSEAASGDIVADLRPRRFGAMLALAPRDYAVQQRGSEEYREYRVKLRAGQTADLAQTPYRSVRYDRLVRQRGGTRSVVHGLRLLGGARGALLDGEGATQMLSIGYGVDLPWLSLGVRARAGRASDDRIFARERLEWSAGLSIERFTDLPWLSISFGLLAEVIQHTQRFETVRDAPSVQATGGAFSGLIGVEKALFGGLNLRLEGGPSTVLIPITTVRDGAPAGSGIDAIFTGWGALGVVWRL